MENEGGIKGGKNKGRKEHRKDINRIRFQMGEDEGRQMTL
jgi:hypothetical protein